MLAASNRLRLPKDISRVYKVGAYGAGGGVLSVKAAPNGRPQHRAVVVVSKKIDKRAVVRNRLRRRLTEIIRHHLETGGPGYDIVVTVHIDFRAMSEPDLVKYLLTGWQRAHIITDK